MLGTFFDGIARHTEEGHDFVRRAAESGFREAVRERDEPFGDHGLEGFGGRPRVVRAMSDRRIPARDHAREVRAFLPGQLPRRPRDRAAGDRGRPRARAGSSSTAATCTPAGSSTAASGPRSATPSPPGRPSAASRRGHDFTTIELKLNVFAAGLLGDEIVAEAEPLHVGRSTVVIEVRIERIREGASASWPRT